MSHTANDFTVEPDAAFRPRERIGEGIINVAAVRRVQEMPKSKQEQVLAWAATEEIVIGLVNVMMCGHCNTLINYNGLPPEICPKCGLSSRGR